MNSYNMVPIVIEQSSKGERSFDIYSRLLRDRIIFLGEGIDDHLSNTIVAQLLFLQSEDNSKDIHMYINSGGGVVTAGMAIYDTMNLIKPDVCTYCIGQCASMAAVLLSSGAKGKRFVLPNARVMIHQPSGGAEGQATDINIQAKEISRMKESLNMILAKNCKKSIDIVAKDTERDYFLNADEAVAYGLVDKVYIKK